MPQSRSRADNNGPRKQGDCADWPQTEPPSITIKPKFRVLVVDGDSYSREEIIQVLEREPDLICCGQGNNVLTAPALVATHKPHLILLDADTGEPHETGIVSLLTFEHRDIPILVISSEQEVLHAENALQSGAKGYLMKSNFRTELISACRSLLQGKVYLSHAMSIRLVKDFLHRGLGTDQRPITDEGGQEIFPTI